MSVVKGLIRWARKHQSNPLVEKIVKPLGRAAMSPIWKKREKAFFSTLVEKGSLVYDVGAHTGEKAELFLGLGARVVCIEPQPACLRELHRRFDGNRNVGIVPKGLGPEPGEMTMYICSDSPVLSTVVEDWGETAFKDHKFDKEIKIEVTTLDTLISSLGEPDFIKIDVEGFEQEVLGGLSKPVAKISVEFNKNAMERTLGTLAKLHAMGYTSFNVSAGETAEYVFPSWIPYDELVSYMKKPVEETLWAWGDVYART